MTSAPTAGAGGTSSLPDFAPVPPPAIGPALNDQGFFVGRVQRNLYRAARVTVLATSW